MLKFDIQVIQHKGTQSTNKTHPRSTHLAYIHHKTYAQIDQIDLKFNSESPIN
ncbi:hypothetical protein Hanom_Chr06g00572141 [Helianthus anomalus]